MWNKFEKAADDILRQVVCDCGNYRVIDNYYGDLDSRDTAEVRKKAIEELFKEYTNS
jgi:hypothetical protein